MKEVSNNKVKINNLQGCYAVQYKMGRLYFELLLFVDRVEFKIFTYNFDFVVVHVRVETGLTAHHLAKFSPS
ncbi:hypothetical protein C5167_016429 [Papaver somniferum]|nr:hypothetical protein C5167_016429 [Papaver somniferum]